MNYKRANLEICKSIISLGCVRGQEIEKDMFLVIPGEYGYYGYIFNKNDIAFSMDKVRIVSMETRDIAHMENVKPENEIQITDYLRILPYRKETARKFEAHGKTVWVNCDFLKNIDLNSAKFYQEEGNSIGNIIVVEDGVPVMVALPLRINE